MALPIARNGNIASLTDPNFIHFKDEQTGVLLPSIPGYPDWLPQLQLTKEGRLCFWNFPNVILRSVVSNPIQAGTSQYLRDPAKVTASNPYPPIVADKVGTNGSTNQYFWNCRTYSIMTPEFYKILCDNYFVLLAPMNPGKTESDLLSGFNPVPKIGSYFSFGPWDWIQANAQYYVNRYLKNPYSLIAETPYTHNWGYTLNKASQVGELQKWLSATSFLVEPTGEPGFWDTVTNAIPVAILGIVLGVASIASLGAATPLLAATLQAATAGASGILKMGMTAQQQAQALTDATTLQNSQRVLDVPQMQQDATDLSTTQMTTGQKAFLAAGIIGILALILFLYANRKK